MNDEQWLKVRILQYLLFKADRLKQIAEESTLKLKLSSKLSSSEYTEIYRNLIKHELFEEIFHELIGFMQ